MLTAIFCSYKLREHDNRILFKGFDNDYYQNYTIFLLIFHKASPIYAVCLCTAGSTVMAFYEGLYFVGWCSGNLSHMYMWI